MFFGVLPGYFSLYINNVDPGANPNSTVHCTHTLYTYTVQMALYVHLHCTFSIPIVQKFCTVKFLKIIAFAYSESTFDTKSNRYNLLGF